MPTPHINAQPGDFAETVLMPGDPQRAEHIATRYLEGARRVTDVRNMWGYTGTYKGHRLSVMAHGMGIPSCSIYATELVREYGVKELIRVGSCGAFAADVRLGDVILALGASTDSTALAELLSHCSDEDRQLLVRHYMEGWSSNELAPALGISPVSVRVRLLRIKNALRESLSLSGVGIPQAA